MDLTKARWIEIQFYYICSDILKLRNNIMDVMDLIDNLTMLGTYLPEQIKPLAQEVLSSMRFRPSKEEFCILCHQNKVPVKSIKARIPVHNKVLYNTIAYEKKDPRLFYPRFRPEQIEEIEKFVQTFDIIRKVGLYG